MRESSGVPAVGWFDLDSFSLRQAVAGYLAALESRHGRLMALISVSGSNWCRNHGGVSGRRAHIELFARRLEERGRARATIDRRLSTIRRAERSRFDVFDLDDGLPHGPPVDLLFYHVFIDHRQRLGSLPIHLVERSIGYFTGRASCERSSDGGTAFGRYSRQR